jgi:HEAT repeat protein
MLAPGDLEALSLRSVTAIVPLAEEFPEAQDIVLEGIMSFARDSNPATRQVALIGLWGARADPFILMHCCLGAMDDEVLAIRCTATRLAAVMSLFVFPEGTWCVEPTIMQIMRKAATDPSEDLRRELLAFVVPYRSRASRERVDALLQAASLATVERRATYVATALLGGDDQCSDMGSLLAPRLVEMIRTKERLNLGSQSVTSDAVFRAAWMVSRAEMGKPEWRLELEELQMHSDVVVQIAAKSALINAYPEVAALHGDTITEWLRKYGQSEEEVHHAVGYLNSDLLPLSVAVRHCWTPEEAREVLAEFVDSKNDRLRVAAIRELGRMGGADEVALGILKSKLNSEPTTVKVIVACNVLKVEPNNPEANRIVAGSLRDASVAMALGDNLFVVELIVDALSEPETELNETILTELVNVLEVLINTRFAGENLDFAVTRGIVTLLCSSNAPNDSGLQVVLKLLSPEVARRAWHVPLVVIRGLAARGATASNAVPHLLKLLDEGDISVRLEAAAGLGRIAFGR